jgi:hypothetical protein
MRLFPTNRTPLQWATLAVLIAVAVKQSRRDKSSGSPVRRYPGYDSPGDGGKVIALVKPEVKK